MALTTVNWDMRHNQCAQENRFENEEGPAECSGLAPRRGHAFGARRARWKALAEANILRSTWRARDNALVPFGRGPRLISAQMVHARTKRTFLGHSWAYPGPASGNRSRQANDRILGQI